MNFPIKVGNMYVYFKGLSRKKFMIFLAMGNINTIKRFSVYTGSIFFSEFLGDRSFSK